MKTESLKPQTLTLFPDLLPQFPPLPPPSALNFNNNPIVNSEMNPKSESKQSKTHEIVDLADDDDDNNNDDVSLLYAKPTMRNTGTNPKNAISVERYSDDRDLQLAIMASLHHPQTHHRKKRRQVINLDDDDVVQVLRSSIPKKPFKDPSITEPGQSSNSKPDPLLTFTCDICVESKSLDESFSIMGCTHFYCSDCMNQYIDSKLQENITQIRCPVSNCIGLLEPEDCRTILPPEVFNRWGSALCEAVILASEKFYCPYKDCSALLINDHDGGGERGEVITESECPNCRRLFCAQCKVSWHSGIGCTEYQELNKDERGREDLMLMQLAKNKKWIRCPKCRFYVEKSEGCLFMRCRCGYSFCYNCGAPLINHYCANCKR